MLNCRYVMPVAISLASVSTVNQEKKFFSSSLENFTKSRHHIHPSLPPKTRACQGIHTRPPNTTTSLYYPILSYTILYHAKSRPLSSTMAHRYNQSVRNSKWRRQNSTILAQYHQKMRIRMRKNKQITKNITDPVQDSRGALLGVLCTCTENFLFRLQASGFSPKKYRTRARHRVHLASEGAQPRRGVAVRSSA